MRGGALLSPDSHVSVKVLPASGFYMRRVFFQVLCRIGVHEKRGTCGFGVC